MIYKSIKDFDLPTDVKVKQYELEKFAGRGYTSFGKEHAKGKKEGDLKEFWLLVNILMTMIIISLAIIQKMFL